MPKKRNRKKARRLSNKPAQAIEFVSEAVSLSQMLEG
jgi:hypothetical protein